MMYQGSGVDALRKFLAQERWDFFGVTPSWVLFEAPER